MIMNLNKMINKISNFININSTNNQTIIIESNSAISNQLLDDIKKKFYSGKIKDAFLGLEHFEKSIENDLKLYEEL